MERFLSYSAFNEEFATVANVNGMGDVSAPISNTEGSGDSWPSLFKPFTLAQSKKKKKRKKRKK